ncbi:hypothetical protein FB446DRAFT_649529 [Lentinula raphanica]|nr:hypothetical protein FB446DRAFT_649529 [Lentinula raphanica]
MFAAPGAGGNRQGVRRGGSRSQSTARGGTRAQQRRQWAPPPAPGLTLRQTVERREREAGLRCWDVSCGLAPDDNCPYREIAVERRRQIKIQQDATASEPKYICEHTFHTPCLVTAQRVALNGSEENVVEGGKSVEVSCPICRLSGVLPRDDWEDGVRALEAELD